MKEKEIIRLSATIAHELINMLEKELLGEPKKERSKNGKRKKVSNVDRSSNRSGRSSV